MPVRFFNVPQGRAILDRDVFHRRKLVRCLSCGLVYQEIILKKEVVNKLYNTNSIFSKWGWDAGVRGFDAKFGFMLNKTGSKVRILDIGCHTGGFLSLLPRHWKKYGVDSNPVALEQAAKRVSDGNFYQSFAENINLPMNYFDVITMWDVAEHLYNVGDTFRNVYNLLALNGYLILETGNRNSLPARVFRQKWYYVSFLEHINFFEHCTIRRVLEENGFVVKVITNTVHHKINKIRTVWKSLIFVVLTAVGTIEIFWALLAKLLGSSAVPPILPVRDHMLIVAKKAKYQGKRYYEAVEGSKTLSEVVSAHVKKLKQQRKDDYRSTTPNLTFVPSSGAATITVNPYWGKLSNPKEGDKGKIFEIKKTSLLNKFNYFSFIRIKDIFFIHNNFQLITILIEITTF